MSVFGDEHRYLCERHTEIAKRERANAADVRGYCEYCRTSNVVIKPFRDPEEGTNGQVRQACAPCRKRIVDAFCDGEDFSSPNDGNLPEEDEGDWIDD